MKVEVKISKSFVPARAVIYTDKVNDEVREIVNKISENKDELIGIKNNKAKILNKSDIIKIVANDGKVFAITKDSSYKLKLRLYELETMLKEEKFVRISNSEIINLKKVKNFDLSFKGTILVNLLNDNTAYVSRRYVKKIKNVLGLGGGKK